MIDAGDDQERVGQRIGVEDERPVGFLRLRHQEERGQEFDGQQKDEEQTANAVKDPDEHVSLPSYNVSAVHDSARAAEGLVYKNEIANCKQKKGKKSAASRTGATAVRPAPVAAGDRFRRFLLTSPKAPWHILRNYDFDMILEEV